MAESTPHAPRDVFISYTGEDGPAIAEPIARALQARGVSVWLASEVLRDGQSLTSGIGKALQSAGRVVLVLSPTYFKKGWTGVELRAAVALDAAADRQRIWPLIVGEWDLAKEVPLLVDTVHTVWKGDAAGYADKLASAIGRYPARWHTAEHPDDYVGDVWIRITPTTTERPRRHQVSVLWGPHVLETAVTTDKPVSLLHHKQFPGVTPLYIRTEPDAIVSIGRGPAPDGDQRIIDTGWVEFSDAGTPAKAVRPDV